ncbi:MAG: glutamate racemase [Patescibacteria group bacterium]
MIGIFDSGLGGLTVVKQFLKYLPQYRIMYFGDTANLPYGTKSRKAITNYSIKNTEFLIKQRAKIIVIACHSASSVAALGLRKKFPQIPIFDVIKGGLTKAVKESKHKKIGIIGTAATIKSGVHEKFLKSLDPEIKVFSQACPLLVPLIEEGFKARPETKRIVRYYLREMKSQFIDTLVLACTHYPLLYKVFFEVLNKRVKIIDPAQEVAGEVLEFLKKNPKIEKQIERDSQKYKFFISDKPYRYEEFSQRILGKKIKFKVVNLE